MVAGQANSADRRGGLGSRHHPPAAAGWRARLRWRGSAAPHLRAQGHGVQVELRYVCRGVQVLAAEYPDGCVDDVIVDTFAMRLVRDPQSFDVTTNTFGDILSDEALAWSAASHALGCASATVTWRCAGYPRLAPDIAGKDRQSLRDDRVDADDVQQPGTAGNPARCAWPRRCRGRRPQPRRPKARTGDISSGSPPASPRRCCAACRLRPGHEDSLPG